MLLYLYIKGLEKVIRGEIVGKIKSFFKTAGIYFVGSVLSKLIGFLLLPLYTNHLSPSVMGEYDYIVTIMSFLSPICFFQIWDAMFRFSFDYTSIKSKNKVMNNTLMTFLLGSLLYSICFIIISKFIFIQYFYLAIIYGFLISLNYLYTYIARAHQRNGLFVLSGFLNSLTVAISNIVMILYFDMGLSSLYLSAIFGSIVQVMMIEISIKPLKSFNIKDFDKDLINQMIRFSLPLCIATISYWLLSGLTKVIIVKQLGTYENGLYAVTNKFAMLLNTVVSIFQFAWNELAYVNNKDKNRKVMYQLATKYIIRFVIVSASILILFAKIVFPFIIGNDYIEALYYLPASIIAVSFNAIAGFLGTIFSTEKKTKFIFTTTVIASSLNLILGPVFTIKWKLMGAIVALLLSFGLLMLSRIIILNRKLDIKITGKSLSAILVYPFTLLVFYKCNNIYGIVSFILLIIAKELFVSRKFIINTINTIRR